MHGRHQDDSRSKSAENEEPLGDDSACAGSSEQKNGSEAEPRDVQDGTKQKKHPE